MGRTSQAKDRLLQTAFDLIWTQSYSAVSVDQICERADVRKGSFYHFFASKSDLTVAAYEQNWSECRAHYDQVFSPQVAPLERLKRYCDMVCQSQSQKFAQTGQVLGCPFASVGSELSSQDEKVRKKSVEMFDRFSCYLESALRDAHRAGLVPDQDFKNTADSINGYIMGMLMQAKIRNDVTGLCRMYTTIARMIGAKESGESNQLDRN